MTLTRVTQRAAFLVATLPWFTSWSRSVLGQCPQGEHQVLQDTAPNESNYYGEAVAVSGDRIAVGASLEDSDVEGSGVVRFYRRVLDEWSFEAQVLAGDRAAGDGFGGDVDVVGDAALVGAPFADAVAGNSGAVYVLRHIGGVWGEEQKLTAADGGGGDLFGSVVDLDASGTVALVGAWGKGAAAPMSGAAYVFRFEGSAWGQEQRLTASDARRLDLFGTSVSVDGDVAVIGSIAADGGVAGAGAAYVFRFDGSQWVEEQKLASSDATGAQRFGQDVAVQGDWIVVGASQEGEGGVDAGAAYAFRHDGTRWNEEQKLLGTGLVGTSFLGHSVALDGGRVMLGAPRDDRGGADAGATLLFEWDGGSWVQTRTLEASLVQAGAQRGWAVDLEGGVAVSGAPRDTAAGVSIAGNARVYHLSAGALALDASPNTVTAADTLAFTTWCGGPGRPAFLFSVDVNGLPLVFRVATGTFDAQRRWSTGAMVPPGLGALTVTFLAFGATPSGQPAVSDPERVSFL